MEVVAGYLKEVGVQAEIQYVEPGVWGQLSEKHERKGLSFPGWSGRDAEIVLNPILHTGQYQSYFSNKELDKLLEEGASTLDQTKRKEAYSKAVHLIQEEAPHIPLFQTPAIYGLNKNLDWIPRGDDIINLRNASFK